MANMLEYVKICDEELRSALAPLTAPNPTEAQRIEAAIAKLIDAKIHLAMSNIRYGSTENW